MVYGQTLQVPGDLLRTSASGIAEPDPDTILAKLRSTVARPPAPTTGLHGRTTNWPKSAEKATHVYVKLGHPTPLGPIKAGPFPIANRLPTKSTLKLMVGNYIDGRPRYEVHHWENCQPAAMAPEAPTATRPALGRRPVAPQPLPAGETAPRRAASTSADPAGPLPEETPESTPAVPPEETPEPGPPVETLPSEASVPAPPTTRSGRAVRPAIKSDYHYY